MKGRCPWGQCRLYGIFGGMKTRHQLSYDEFWLQSTIIIHMQYPPTIHNFTRLVAPGKYIWTWVPPPSVFAQCCLGIGWVTSRLCHWLRFCCDSIIVGILLHRCDETDMVFNSWYHSPHQLINALDDKRGFGAQRCKSPNTNAFRLLSQNCDPIIVAC